MTDAPQVSSNVTYQTAVLNPDLVNMMVVDDSPPMVADRLWAFFGVDIPVADIKSFDFKNILDMVDINFANKLGTFQEEEWDKVVVQEVENVFVDVLVCEKCNKAWNYDNDISECPECKGALKKTEIEQKVVKRMWFMVELWDDVRAKVYQKMCRAREGFTLRQLTENKSRQISEEYITERPMTAPLAAGGQPEQKKGWSLF